MWEEVTGQLEHLVVDGTDYYLDPSTLERYTSLRRAATAPLLAPAFDENILGYADRSALLADDHFESVVPGRNGRFKAVVIDAGRAVGTWPRDRNTEVLISPFESPVSPKVVRALPRLARTLPR